MMVGLLIAIVLLQGNVEDLQERVENTPKLSFWDRWSVGVEGGGGLTLQDSLFDDLAPMAPNLGLEFGLAGFSLEYSAQPRYLVTPKYIIKITGGYMRSSAKNRRPNIKIQDTTHWWTYHQVRWDIEVKNVIVSLQRLHKNKFWEIGAGYFTHKAVDEELASDLGTYPSERRKVVVTTCGRGYGCHGSIGLKGSSSIGLNGFVSLTLRLGETRETSNNASGDVIWLTPVSIEVSGAYISFGISYDIP